MENKELPEGFQTWMDKKGYELALHRYLWGFTRTAILAFVIGKLVGYFGFLSWWYIAVPWLIGALGALMYYLDWVPDRRILL